MCIYTYILRRADDFIACFFKLLNPNFPLMPASYGDFVFLLFSYIFSIFHLALTSPWFFLWVALKRVSFVACWQTIYASFFPSWNLMIRDLIFLVMLFTRRCNWITQVENDCAWNQLCIGFLLIFSSFCHWN